MAIRRHPDIIVDINNRSIERVVLEEGESQGTILPFIFVDNGRPFSLTGKTVNFYLIKPSGKRVLNSCQVTDPGAGKVDYTVTDQTVSESGRALINLQILEGESIAYSGTLYGQINYTGMGGGSEGETNIFTEVVDKTKASADKAEGYALSALEAYTKSEEALRITKEKQEQACACAKTANEILAKVKSSEQAAKASETAAEASADSAAESAKSAAPAITAATEAKEAADKAKASETKATSEAVTATAERAEVQKIKGQIVTEEEARKTAEAERARSEAARKDGEQGRQDAEAARSRAEKSRSDAEAARSRAEKARATADSQRQARADSDHDRAEGDHTQSLADQAQHKVLVDTISKFESGEIAADVVSLKQNKADKSYVDGKIEALIGTAPEALDTLGEIASELNKQGDLATTLTAQIGTKADAKEVGDKMAALETGLQAKINAKASTLDMAAELAKKADKIHTHDQYADKSKVESLDSDVKSLKLASSTHDSDLTAVKESLAMKADKSELAKKADKATVDNSLAMKADKSDLDKKVDTASFDNLVSSLNGKETLHAKGTVAAVYGKRVTICTLTLTKANTRYLVVASTETSINDNSAMSSCDVTVTGAQKLFGMWSFKGSMRNGGTNQVTRYVEIGTDPATITLQGHGYSQQKFDYSGEIFAVEL